METIQVVLDKKLLQDADRAARRVRQNRSALIRDALREHLKNLATKAMEQRDRDGFSRTPPAARDESLIWEAEASWPDA
jgi:metal-responsive CopG/Arc/MetJ family transcriptional regulator